MNKYLERVYNGLIKENPTFVLMLGMCPTLAVTTSAMNALGMGLSTTVVLIFSNLLISLFRRLIHRHWLNSLVYISLLLLLTVLSLDEQKAMHLKIHLYCLS